MAGIDTWSFHLPMTVPVFCYLRFKQSGMLEVTGATIITICHLGGILSLIMARRLSASTCRQWKKRNTKAQPRWHFHPEGESSDVPMLYGTAAARAKRDVTVYAVNLKSGEKTKHRNATVAGKTFGISPGGVSAVILGKRKSERGYWFTYDADAEPPAAFGKASVRFHKEQPVIAVKLATGEKIAFASAKTASESLRISRSSISLILNPDHPKRAAKGYTFELVGRLASGTTAIAG
jgi:hypothetical protein